MDFPILTLLDTDASVDWISQHFHPDGFGCPHCQAHLTEARFFRTNRGSCLPVYRCRACQGVYTLYSHTLFEGSQLLPAQVVLLLRGVFQGQSSAQLARELELTEKTVLKWRHRLQAEIQSIQPTTPLPDCATESDELFQNAGEKGDEHFDPLDPPRSRANKRRGRGTYANDRPPVLGTVGRVSGQVRLRVVLDTKQTTLRAHVEQFTGPGTHVYTDEYDSYATIERPHTTVCHGAREWARDADGDGTREAHTNTCEGMWAGLRTYLRVFRGVHKRYLSGYVALHEFRVNLKAVSALFVAAVVTLH
jgi:transposase-like protein